jgi:hypothetical protein
MGDGFYEAGLEILLTSFSALVSDTYCDYEKVKKLLRRDQTH